MDMGQDGLYRPNGSSQQQLDILIIENDPASARLTKEAFREAGLTRGVRSVPDGDEALAHLRRQGQHAAHPHPDLIFLDLHLPKKSGLEVLAELKANPTLCATPVVVVSGSEDPNEVREAYELHASCYIRKPDDLHNFLRFIQVCFEFWGSVVTLPPKPELAAGMH
jgi:chemotaxis family two-component system response regulator Rcp1